MEVIDLSIVKSDCFATKESSEWLLRVTIEVIVTLLELIGI
jgi:hypothetical protein